MVDSRRKIDRTERLRTESLSPQRGEPGSDLFDPEMAAVLSMRGGDLDNAFWLAFLSVHFGRHAVDEWQLTRRVYGALGAAPYWTWSRVSADVDAFRDWLRGTLRQRNQPLGRFGNHRKYESLDPESAAGTPAVLRSYVNWIRDGGGHVAVYGRALTAAGGDPRRAFGHLYRAMNVVTRFGRLAKFDYLTLIGKLGLSPIEADSTYMAGATGPRRGAALLFEGTRSSPVPASQLELAVQQLERHLGVGMQAMEDSLCNWQKSPTSYQAFRG
jgi:hypothetical protein